MSLRNDIINIRVPEYVESSENEHSRIAWKLGHKAARHEAAELAMTYDNLMEVIERDLEVVLNYTAVSREAADVLRMTLQAIQKVESGEYK